MLTIKLYQFSKNKNSTKLPDNSVTQVSYSALMKTASSLINPVITIKESPIGYNYCYITDFERYYFINDIVYNLGEWELSLTVDPLASFKTDIGNITVLVTRSASNKNGLLKDELYPLTGGYTSAVQTWTPFDIDANGYYYVSTTGSVRRTWQMTRSVFDSLCDAIMSYGGDGTFWSTVEQCLQNSANNPIDYVANCYWLPFSMTNSGVGTNQIQVGTQLFSLSAAAFPVYNKQHTIAHTFTLSDHPQASVRGVYCNMNPYSEHILSAAGFGNISVPGDILTKSSNTVDVSVMIDTTVGDAVLVAKANGVRFARINSGMGVNIPLTQRTKNVVGGATSIITGATGVGLGMYTGDIGRTVSAASTYIGGISEISRNLTSTTGSNGSMTGLFDNISLTSVWHTFSGFDNDNNGCPYSQNVQISTLSGFTQCEKGVFKSSKASETEINEINAYMVNGFYYE